MEHHFIHGCHHVNWVLLVQEKDNRTKLKRHQKTEESDIPFQENKVTLPEDALF